MKNKKRIMQIGILGIFVFFSFLLSNSASAAIGPNVVITANPEIVDSGYTSIISWDSTDVVGCTSPEGGSGLDVSFQSEPLYESKIFTVQCYYYIGDDTDPDMQIGYRNHSVLVTVRETGVEPLDIINVVTKDASDITQTGATLKGSLNPGGRGVASLAKAYFRYSPMENHPPIFCNDIFGSKMRATNEIHVWGETTQDVAISVGNLEPHTKYYYCLVGSNDNQIDYGGVKSFTTNFFETGNGLISDAFLIETKNALVVNSTSAYLKGYYQTSVPAETYFEYRRTGFQNNGGGSNISLGEKIENFFGKKYAQATSMSNYSWTKVGSQKHLSRAGGNINYFLKGLLPSATYQYRAVIKANTGSDIIYGIIFTFTTKASSSTGDGTSEGGLGYEDPCDNPLYDINCNGTGGTGGGGGKVIGPGLPDLVVSPIVPTSVFVNVPTKIFATVRNQGRSSTGKSFFGFFQASTINPNLQKTDGRIENKPAGTAFDNLQKFFRTDSALASDLTNTSTGTSGLSLPLTTFPAISIPILMAKASTTINTELNFSAQGTYYVRACADKKTISDIGLISESYENNNCGPWTAVVAGNTSSMCLDRLAENPNEPLPCEYLIDIPDETLCQDAAAKNFGSFLPCIYENGYCLDYGAKNYKEPLPCEYLITPPDGTLCQDPTAKNFGSLLPCIYSSIACADSRAINYGEVLPCRYYNNWGNGGNGNTNGNSNGNLTLGQIATPPSDAIVRYHEGIEHVFVRQIMKNTDIQNAYGYKQDNDLQNFAWSLADLLARSFGYVADSGKEIRVSLPDIAAYELQLNGSQLIVYEYFDSKIVNIENTTTILRNTHDYEYYFVKR